MGKEDFKWLQDAWAPAGNRRRWSVAFPIVRTFEIVGTPRTREVFSVEIFRRVYQSQNALLRSLDDQARAELAELEVIEVESPDLGIALDQDFDKANRSTISAQNLSKLEQDLRTALEGETVERRQSLLKRAAWMADSFANLRAKAGTLVCDHCGFDPKTCLEIEGIKLRSCFDVHHLHPLAEGKRMTDHSDLALLCPTCHRIEHLRLNRVGAVGLGGKDA